MKSLRAENILLGALLLLAFALRVYRLGAQAIWWDESLSVYRATRDLPAVLSNVILIQNGVTIDTLPQLYFIFLNLLVHGFGITEFALRFFSVMANVATLPLIYVLARRWLGTNVALVAVCLAALAPFYVWFSQEARPYTLVLFWSTLAIYALTRVSGIERGQTPTNVDKNNFSLWIIVYIFAAAASLYTHYYALFLLPFHAILIALFVWQSPRQRILILLPMIPFASMLLLVPQILASMAGNVNSGPTFVPLQTILVDLLNSFSVGVSANLADVWWIDAALAALFFIGVLSARSTSGITNYQLPIAILAFILVPTLAVFAASFIRPLYQNSRYLIALSPAFYIGVAAGIVALARRWKLFLLPSLGIFLIGAVLSLNNLYFNPLFGKDDHRGWAMDLREQARPGDFLILDSPHTEELYRYYADDLVPMTTLPMLRAGGDETAIVREALAKYARVWYLGLHVPFDDPNYRIEKILDQEGVIINQVSFAGTSTEIVLALYMRTLPTANANDIPHPMDVAFNGHLHLRGYDAPNSITAGKRGTVKLYWQIDEPVGEDYAVSLRLADEAGAILGQWDSTPLGNRAGTSTWEANQIMLATQDVTAKGAPGKYRLVVVPYHAATGNPLGDVITLTDVEIK